VKRPLEIESYDSFSYDGYGGRGITRILDIGLQGGRISTGQPDQWKMTRCRNMRVRCHEFLRGWNADQRFVANGTGTPGRYRKRSPGTENGRLRVSHRRAEPQNIKIKIKLYE
jgi:hypothetical protein